MRERARPDLAEIAVTSAFFVSVDLFFIVPLYTLSPASLSTLFLQSYMPEADLMKWITNAFRTAYNLNHNSTARRRRTVRRRNGCHIQDQLGINLYICTLIRIKRSPHRKSQT